MTFSATSVAACNVKSGQFTNGGVLKANIFPYYCILNPNKTKTTLIIRKYSL